MTAHDHTEYVPGCFRCDLTGDELGATAPVSPEQREALARQLHDSHTTRLCVGPALNPDCEACHDDADTVIAAGWSPPGAHGPLPKGSTDA